MSLFAYLKSNLSLIDIVSEYVSLKKAGTYWKGHCPFHHEKDASFTVSPDRGIFYCFGCHQGGDVIAFIAKIENCSQAEAARFLIDKYHLNPPASLAFADQNSPEPGEKKRYFQTCETVAQWAHEQLKKYQSALTYVLQRGIDAKYLDLFQIGYLPGGLQAIKYFLAAMNQKNILAQDLMKAGILQQGKNIFYSPFEERIIFPIKDGQGNFCGFGARSFKEGDDRPKYYNSHENDFFTKGSIVFGLDIAKQTIQQEKTVFLVEGYFDTISMVQHGFTNTIATLGTACTVEHLKILSRYAEILYVLYDGDNAGQKAILRLTELCWQASLDLKVIQLPSNEDPDSFLQKKHDLKPLIAQAQDIFSFFLHTVTKEYRDDLSLQKKLQLIRSFLTSIKKIDDPLKQDLLLQQAAQIFNLPFSSLSRETKRLNFSSNQPTPYVPPIEDKGNLSTLEKKIFSAIIKSGTSFSHEQKLYIIENLSSPLHDIAKKINLPDQGDELSFNNLSQDEQQLVYRLIMEYESDHSKETNDMLLDQFYKKYWKKILNGIKEKVSEAVQLDNKKRIEQLLNELGRLKNILKDKGCV